MRRTESRIFPDVNLIEPDLFTDNRGYFMESYSSENFQQLGVKASFVQDNHSYSIQAGTIRGLHYQLPPTAQAKLVRVLQGAVFDVIVDVRENSKTFGNWESFILTADNHRQLFVPHGFAHGFCTLVPSTHVLYKVDAYYHPESEAGILWSDPRLDIPWPTSSPTLSERDLTHPILSGAKRFCKEFRE